MTFALKVEGLGKKYPLNSSNKIDIQSASDKFLHFFSRRKGYKNSGNATQNEFWALKDISFTIEPGARLGVIGKNGAGKSTLLKILSRITEPTAGRVLVNGKMASLLEVGTGFHPELSGRENVFLNGSILGLSKSKIKSLFDEIVAFSGVEKFIDVAVKHYSSGMQVRLAFAVAAHLEPEILILDEVLAVGDAAFQNKCLQKMKDISNSGTTIIFVSHGMGSVRDFCNEILLLESGKVKLHTNDLDKAIGLYLDEDKEEYRNQWVRQSEKYDSDYFTPLAIRLTDFNCMPINSAKSRDDTVYIEIDGNIKKEEADLNLGYVIYDEAYNQLYWTFASDNPKNCLNPYNSGRVRLRSRIPTEMLNPGHYKLALIGGIFCKKWLYEPNTPGAYVDLIIEDQINHSHYWPNGKRPGMIAPYCKWDVFQ